MEKKRIGIIGGGISGTCLGYHLSLYDNAEVIVFEKDTIGGASTAKSAGTVCLFDDSLRNRYWDVRLYGFESYLKMEAEEKGSAGFDKTGTLVVATDEKVEATIKTGIALAKAAGYTGEYITDKDRIKEILPDISTDNILGAGYTQDDGYFDGTMISNTYAKKMQKNGGVIKTGVKVTEVLKEGNKIKGLKTDDGQDYEFDYVVDCTGPWSKFTGEMVGMDVPIWHTKAEAFFLCPPGKKLGYTFPVLKYPAFYALRAGDNIFICKSHLSMDLSNPMHAGQWDPDKLPALLETLRMPKKLTEFATLFSESLRDGFEKAADGKEILSVLRRKDALRRPERFVQLLRLLKAAHRIDSDEKWLTSAEAVRSLDFRSISAGAADKSRIPQLIEEASVRAIDEVLDKLADQHQYHGDENGTC